MKFLFPRQIARVSYLLRSVALGAAIALPFDRADAAANQIDFTMTAVVLLALAYWLFFVVAPRCRDLALSPWLTLLVFVPGVDLFFCGYLAWGRSKVRADWLNAPAAD